MSPEPTAVEKNRFYSYSTLGKQHTQFLWPEQLVLLSGAKFLLLDWQRQLSLEVHDGPLHHHEAVLIQQIREEQGLWGREGAGDESGVLGPLCLGLLGSAAQCCPAASSHLAITRVIAWRMCCRRCWAMGAHEIAASGCTMTGTETELCYLGARPWYSTRSEWAQELVRPQVQGTPPVHPPQHSTCPVTPSPTWNFLQILKA